MSGRIKKKMNSAKSIEKLMYCIPPVYYNTEVEIREKRLIYGISMELVLTYLNGLLLSQVYDANDHPPC